MTKLNQIQQALLAIGEGKFQKLADEFLFLKGYKQINSIGSVFGADKVSKGTPDTLVALSNGKYIFYEHTTQQTGQFKKMHLELDKCFNEKKTGIPVEKIEKVLFCFTTELTTAETYILGEKCRTHGVSLEIFGRSRMAMEIRRYFPGLAKEYLGVSIDTDQIVTLRRFIDRYNRNKTATRLDHDFRFREEALESALLSLERDVLCILTGAAGVGKSRLAVEACERFKEHYPDWEVWVIHGRNRDLWEDLESYFSKPGKYLILVDDANRVTQFSYVIDIFMKQGNERDIKVIATVRDYALEKIEEDADPVGGGQVIKLEPFSEDQTKQLVKAEYGIVNDLALWRIARITHGNPRLAIMAAKVAIESDSLESIEDISSLYEKYFSSIWGDIEDQEMEGLLKVAAIVSFFKAVDRTHDVMMKKIEAAFEISESEFWRYAIRLHDLEWLNIYENENKVVRISDQVLSTYLFYQAFFKKKVFSFGVLLDWFYPKYWNRLRDSVHPVLDAFDRNLVLKTMRPHVDSTWRKLEPESEEHFYNFLHEYWYVLKTKTLKWLSDHIESLEACGTEVNQIDFDNEDTPDYQLDVLSILGNFAYGELENAQIAIEIILRYLAKRKKEAPRVLKKLGSDFGFRNHWHSLELQEAILNLCWRKTVCDEHFFSIFFLKISEGYLWARSLERYPEGASLETLQPERWIKFRQVIWEKIFLFAEKESLFPKVLSTIKQYANFYMMRTNRQIVLRDSKHLFPFLCSKIKVSRYFDCLVLKIVYYRFKKHGVDMTEELEQRCLSEIYVFFELLLHSEGERRDLGLDNYEYGQFKYDLLEKATRDFSYQDYVILFERAVAYQKNDGLENYSINKGVLSSLSALADRDADLFYNVFSKYLKLGDPLKLDPISLIGKLLKIFSLGWFTKLLSQYQFPDKSKWVIFAFALQKPGKLSGESLEDLYRAFENAASWEQHIVWLEHLQKYLEHDPGLILKVVGILVDRSKENPSLAYPLRELFNFDFKIGARVFDLFRNNMALLMQAYLCMDSFQTNKHDLKGEFFNQLLDFDADFLRQFVEWRYAANQQWRLPEPGFHRDFSFIWSRDDHQSLLENAIQKTSGKDVHGLKKMEFLFLAPGFRKYAKPVQKAQNEFLLNLIYKHYKDAAYIKSLFGMIGQFEEKRRTQFIKRFLERDKNFAAFKCLAFDTGSNLWEGSSRVPYVQKQIDLWRSLVPFLNTVDLLEHKLFVEGKLLELEFELEAEKKIDFMGLRF